MQKKSLFIVIEGLDGSGKSTAGKILVELLEKKYPSKVKFTYEPNDESAGGKFIRDTLTKKITNFHPRQLALSFAANRLDHCSRVVVPMLEKAGGIVISDRYYLSSLVYQSAPDYSMSKVWKLNENALTPDLIFFLNVSDETCYQRMNKRNQPRELFENNLDQTRKKFLKGIRFLKKKKENWIVEIDGNGTPDETVAQMQNELKKRFSI